MSIKKVLRWLMLTVVGIIGFVIIVLIVGVGPVMRTPVEELEVYNEMQRNLSSLDTFKVRKPTEGLSVGWAKVNITPTGQVATAGYGNRWGEPASGVRDSIFVRAMVVSNGAVKIAMVTADLLIIPPLVRERLADKLSSIGFSLTNTYLGATHTHNSVGDWAGGATQLMYGKLDDGMVDFLAASIVECIDRAAHDQKRSTLRAAVIPIGHVVQNRLIKGGPEDSLLRVVEVRRTDSSKMMLMSFTAHATCLYSRDLEISRDYPGKLVDEIESNGYSFAMFFAGAVGSHKPSPPSFGGECIDWMAKEIAKGIESNQSSFRPVHDSTLAMITVPLPLSDPQLKINNELKARSWVFKTAMGEFPVVLTCLRIGTVVFLGTPCDFSGEFNPTLDKFAASRKVMPIVTSFNGGYIGYLTPENRFDIDHYETRLMNWYAPGTGEEVTQSLEVMMDHVIAN